MNGMDELYSFEETLEKIESLTHYGMPKRSGRYPYGSGEDPYQHSGDFLSRVEKLKKSGWKETPENIKKEFGLSSTQYRIEKSLAKDERRMLQVSRAKSLRADGLTNTEIGRQMGVNESTVRSWFDGEKEARMNQAKETAAFIKKEVDKNGMVDVGKHVERELNISKEKLNEALYILEREGYPVYKGGIPQATNKGQQTNQKVICVPGTPHKDIYNFDKVHSLMESEYISRDGGDTFEKKFVYPKSMDSSRLKIRYAEEGGDDKDGIVEIRRGVDDLSLGKSHYAQVRILVDDTKYIKGMAVYSDDMPPGVDVVFNTNKKSNVSKMDVLKDIKPDPDNPFGALIKEDGGQSYYTDKNGKRQLSLINKKSDEGDWTEWKDTLPSQFLGKQSKSLAQKQLDLAKADKQDEFETICSLTNPTVKKYYLQKFSDECDAAAVHLKAAALPGQKYHVILPINTLKENEVYAPGYEPGTKLALIRYPHGGTFEIPILTVNNKNKLGKEIIGTTSIDAIGIKKSVADRLSGADFDGDTVMCIPTHDRAGKVKITSTKHLEGLEGFDNKLSYGAHEVKTDENGNKHYYRDGREYRIMKNTGTEMGVISNLITDMTLAGASPEKMARAVRHSMVVIDAEKHKLDYKQSEIDNNIAALKKEYQVKENGRVGGASTILSRSKGQESVDKRQGTPNINQKGKPWYDPNKEEGAYIYKRADDADYTYTKVNKRTGETTVVTKTRKQQSTKMAETDDAHTLVSTYKHPMELIYADYANSMKSLANRARKEMVYTGDIVYSKTAGATYKKEVDSLKSKLNRAELNSPRERAAQRKANAEVKAKMEANPDAKPKDRKKWSQQALTKYREELGSVSRRNRAIEITDKEWEAIQAGAVNKTTLRRILNNTDVDNLRERSMPNQSNKISETRINRVISLSRSNYTLEEIARKTNMSTSQVSKILKGEK